MKNLEQIRAKNALASKNSITETVGNPHKKIPALILQNGLIATAAFALEKSKGLESVFSAVIKHLKDVKLYDGEESTENFLEYLTQRCTHEELRHITQETMAYLSYLRRFVKGQEE